MSRSHPACDRCLTKQALDPLFSGCDAHLGSPCMNCQHAGLGQKSCQLRRPPSAARVAMFSNGTGQRLQCAIESSVRATAPTATRFIHPRVQLRRRIEEQNLKDDGPQRMSPAVVHTTRSSAMRPPRVTSSAPLARPGPRPAAEETQTGEPAEGAFTPRPAKRASSLNSTTTHSSKPAAAAPKALRGALDHLPGRAQEAERERARIRADSRRTQEQQDKITNLQARLELEMRARTAAEERARIAYDQGYRYGIQTMKARLLAKMSPLARAMLPYSTLRHTQGNGLNQQPMLGQGLNSLTSRGASSSDRTQEHEQQKVQAPFAKLITPETMPSAWETPGLRSSRKQSLVGISVSQSVGFDASDYGHAIGDSLPHVRLPEDTQLQALRLKALASTAAFRDRQAADEWLDRNSHLLESSRSTTGGQHVVGEKRKRVA